MYTHQSFESCLNEVTPDNFFEVIKRNSTTRGYLKNCHAFWRIHMPCMKKQNGSALYFIPNTFVASKNVSWLGRKTGWCCRCLSRKRDADTVECCLTRVVMLCTTSTALFCPLNSRWRIQVASENKETGCPSSNYGVWNQQCWDFLMCAAEQASRFIYSFRKRTYHLKVGKAALWRVNPF